MQSEIPKWLVVGMACLSLLGFIDATYLTIVHITGNVPLCTVTQGCDIVTTSAYATIGRIPVSLLGAIYYLGIFFLSIFVIDKNSVIAASLLGRLTWVGMLAAVYFVFVQLFIIQAICLYCMVSAAVSTLIFMGGIVLSKRNSILLS